MAKMLQVIKIKRVCFCVSMVWTLLSACTFDSDLPANLQIECEDKEDCPQGFICRIDRCVEEDNNDFAAPEIVGPISIAPSKGKAGTIFELEFFL